MDNTKKQGKKPFFARLLEQQELENVTGGADGTLKYPSDSDEGGGKDVLTTSIVKPPDATTKYPSDSDEGGV